MEENCRKNWDYTWLNTSRQLPQTEFVARNEDCVSELGAGGGGGKCLSGLGELGPKVTYRDDFVACVIGLHLIESVTVVDGVCGDGLGCWDWGKAHGANAASQCRISNQCFSTRSTRAL